MNGVRVREMKHHLLIVTFVETGGSYGMVVPTKNNGKFDG